MILTSVLYLTFIIFLLIVYYTVPKKVQWISLLIFNSIFLIFASSKIIVWIYIFYVVLISYFGAIIINKIKNRKYKFLAQSISVILIFGLLFILKYMQYFNMYLENILNIFGLHYNIITLNFEAPIGISFFSLMAMGYLIDVGRETIEPQKNFFKLFLYILYFPQLTSGPITKYSEMKNELYEYHNFNIKNIFFGFQRILWGILKKLVIAERAAIIVNFAFSYYDRLNGMDIFIAVILFAIQLYADFSGCMDIVLGTSEMLGIKLPENFDTPFFSKSISEYWRRWHITLGVWFKEYIFYPLLRTKFFQNMQKKSIEIFGKSMGRKITTYCAMFILWFLVGAWHGGEMKFIIGSGLLHWFYIVYGEICDSYFNKIAIFLKVNKENKIFKIYQSVRTFLLVCLGFIFFRASNVPEALDIIKSILTNNYTNYFQYKSEYLGLDFSNTIVLIFSILLLFYVSLMKNECNIREEIYKRNIIINYTILGVLIISILVFGYYGIDYNSESFIYQNF